MTTDIESGLDEIVIDTVTEYGVDDLDLYDIDPSEGREEGEGEDASISSVLNWKPVEMPSFFSHPLMDEDKEVAVSSKSELKYDPEENETVVVKDTNGLNDVQVRIETKEERKARKRAEKAVKKGLKEKKIKKDKKKSKHKGETVPTRKQNNTNDNVAREVVNSVLVEKSAVDKDTVQDLSEETSEDEYSIYDEDEDGDEYSIYDEDEDEDEEECEEVDVDENIGDDESDCFEDEENYSSTDNDADSVVDDGFSLGYDEEAGEMDYDEDKESDSSTLWVSRGDTVKFQVQNVHGGSSGESRGSPSSSDGDREQRIFTGKRKHSSIGTDGLE